MSLHFDGQSIQAMYLNGVSIKEAHFSGQLVFSADRKELASDTVSFAPKEPINFYARAPKDMLPSDYDFSLKPKKAGWHTIKASADVFFTITETTSQAHIAHLAAGTSIQLFLREVDQLRFFAQVDTVPVTITAFRHDSFHDKRKTVVLDYPREGAEFLVDSGGGTATPTGYSKGVYLTAGDYLLRCEKPLMINSVGRDNPPDRIKVTSDSYENIRIRQPDTKVWLIPYIGI